MKTLIKILIVGAVLFNVVCIIQDWRNFFRVGQPSVPAGDPELEAELANTIQQFVSIARHAYQSGGDPRFAERIPASESVIAELFDEIAYLEKNGRVQLAQLARFEVLDVERTAVNRAVVRTAEDWLVYTADPETGARFEPDQAHAVHAEYRLVRSGPGWLIAEWTLVPPPEPESQQPSEVP